MKSKEITACVKFEYSHAPFDLSKVIELTEKINEILIEAILRFEASSALKSTAVSCQ